MKMHSKMDMIDLLAAGKNDQMEVLYGEQWVQLSWP